MKRTALATTWLLMATAAAVAADDRPQVSVRPAFAPGEYLQVIQQVDQHEQKSEGQQATTEVVQTTEILLSVDKPTAAGDVKIQVAFRRLAQSFSQGESKRAFDTAKPDEGDKELGRSLLAVTKGKATATVGADGKVKEVSGLDSMWDELAKTDPTAAALKASYGDATVRTMLERMSTFFPDKPVRPGDKWVVSNTGNLPVLGKTQIKQDCQLKAVETAAIGQAATITVAGTIEAKDRKTTVGATPATLRSMKIDMAGEYRVPLGNTLLTSGTVTQQAAMTMEIDGPAGAEAAPKSRMSSTSTSKIAITSSAVRPG
ncbi:MAG: DUF6263 family protein [Phycisphaerae bacterium]|nr:DUF6263 family protein [Phycisphaerae bacterium]